MSLPRTIVTVLAQTLIMLQVIGDEREQCTVEDVVYSWIVVEFQRWGRVY
jgi:hypothetical protein